MTCSFGRLVPAGKACQYGFSLFVGATAVRATLVTTSLLLGLLCTCISSHAASDKAADVLRLALPAAAWGLTQTEANDDGAWMFYKSFAATLASTQLLKSTISAPRPDGSDDKGFPSGHAAMAFQGAAFMQRRYGWTYGAPAYVLASYVGYSRVDNRHHYSKDVLAGAVLGIASSYMFTDPAKNWQLQPLFASNQIGLQLSGVF